MPLELTDYERHYILTCPDALLILMDMHDMQQDQADSMDAGCYGDELRREELRQHGAKIIEADPGIWTDEIRRRFAGPTGYAAQRLVRAQQKVPSGVPTPPLAIQPDQLDAQRYRFLRAEHERIDPMASVVWKRGGNRKGYEWVNTASLDREIDEAIRASNAGVPSGEVGK